MGYTNLYAYPATSRRQNWMIGTYLNWQKWEYLIVDGKHGANSQKEDQLAITDGEIVSSTSDGGGTYAVFSRTTAVTSVHKFNTTTPQLALHPTVSTVAITLL